MARLDRELREGTLSHLDYDAATATLTCRRPQAKDNGEPEAFYEQPTPCDVADVLRFVNRECRLLTALAKARHSRKYFGQLVALDRHGLRTLLQS